MAHTWGEGVEREFKSIQGEVIAFVETKNKFDLWNLVRRWGVQSQLCSCSETRNGMLALKNDFKLENQEN